MDAGALEGGAAALAAAYRPVVIRGLAARWPLVAAAREGTGALSSYLLGFDRGAEVEAFWAAPGAGRRFFYAADMRGFNFERRRGPLSGLLRYLEGIEAAAEPPAVYAGALETARLLPGLAEANPLPAAEAMGGVPRIWIGNASIVSTHFDASDNIAVVAAGRRRFTLFPPDQIHNLYAGPLDHTMAGQPASMVDLAAPDLDRYPRFAEAMAHAVSAELEPGDAIFIPALWWHHVEALSPVNVLVNYWWVDSPDMAARFDAMVYAATTIGPLPPERRAAWQAMFDTFVFRKHGDPAEHLAPEHRGVLGTPTPRLRDYVRQYLLRGLQRP
ncbi:cupin-like domain-containing protein [Sphingomonas canadensis]|nr:cupin-like domain-containing protein [Sphingomonas canadensis]